VTGDNIGDPLLGLLRKHLLGKNFGQSRLRAHTVVGQAEGCRDRPYVGTTMACIGGLLPHWALTATISASDR
jgi:hypothetical protein